MLLVELYDEYQGNSANRCDPVMFVIEPMMYYLDDNFFKAGGAMRKKILFILLVAISLANIDAAAADWKYCGGATLLKGEGTITFYDSESMDYTTDGTVRVWVKAIKESVFNLAMKKYKKQVVEKAAQKVINRYYPPYMLANQKTSYDDGVMIIAWEELANFYEIKPRAKILFEITCNARKIRTLSGVNYKNNGETESSSKIGDWNYITPESNGEALHKILCKK